MVDPASLRKEWKELFSSMDTDQSGNITCIELYRFIVKVAKMENNGENAEVKWDDVKKIFKSLDKDGDRSIEWEEFFDVVTSKAKDQQWKKLLEKSSQRSTSERISEDEVKKIFFSIDRDQSGEITQKEAMRACRRTSVMGKLGVEDVEEWLKLTDKNGDGTISYDEFKFAFVGTNMIDL